MFSVRLRVPDGAPQVPAAAHANDDTGDAAHSSDSEASAAALEVIQEFARRTGLAVIEANLPERRVALWGTAGAVGAAFGVAFAHYELDGKVRRGLTGSLRLPPQVSAVVDEVSGLDDSLPDWVSSAIMSQGARRSSVARFKPSQVLLLAGGALIALGFVLHSTHGFGHLTAAQTGKAGQSAARVPAPVPSAAPVANAPAPPASNPFGTSDGPAQFELAAWSALDAGRLQEAQDNFLTVLAADPGRAGAMRGLIAVRRRMGGDNPGIIRQEVAAYQKAIERGAVDEKYPLTALKLLVSAGLAAAAEVEAHTPPGAPHPPAATQAAVPPAPRQAAVPSRGDAQHAATPAPSVPPKQPAAPPAPQAQRPPAASTPPKQAAAPPAPQAQKPPAASAPEKPPAQVAQNGPALGTASTVQTTRAPSIAQPQAPPSGGQPPALAPNRLYAVQVGPVPDRDRAAALVRQLAAGGFAQAQVSAHPGYRVLSEPLPRKTAETLLTTLAGRGIHADVQSLTGDTVQLVFGVFTSQKDAEAASGRIAAAGYDAWVREATVYTIRLAPYPPASVTAITGIVKTGAPEAAITVDPSGSPATPPKPVAVPPAPPAVSGTPPPAPATRPVAAPPNPEPPALAPNRLYAVQVGPVPDRDRAAALVRQLAAGGFAQAQVSAHPGYRVLSEPLPRKTAETLLTTLAGRGIHADVQSLTGDTVQLVFGVFTSQKDAEAASGRIAAAGYDAWVREATVYTIRLAPYPPASVTAITGIVKTGAPEAAIAVDPVP